MNIHSSFCSLTRLAVVLLLFTFLGACATPATVENMGIPAVERYNYEPGRYLSNRISVGTVTGGQETNPMWTSEVGNEEFAGALRDSLETARLLNTATMSDYELDADLVTVDQPVFGFTFTVNTEVRYTLRSKDSGNAIFQQPIQAEGTATTSDAFAGVKRLRIATERSIQANISQLIEMLYNYEQ